MALVPVPARHRAALERDAFRLVAECAAYVPGEWDAQRQRVLRALDGRPDAAEVLELTRRHEVVALVERVISRAAPGHEIARALQPAARRSVLRSLQFHAELGRLRGVFAARGVGVVALKGTGLSQRLYGEVGLRSVADIDLLVAPETLVEAARVLEEAGYRVELPGALRSGSRLELVLKAGHEIHARKEDGGAVDLHWRIESTHRSRFEPLWRPWTEGGELELLYLCLHGARHDWIRMKWLGDVRAWLSRTSDDEWTALEARARELRLEAVLAQAIVLLDWICGFQASPRMLALVDEHRDEAVRRAESAVAKLLGPPPDEEIDTLAQAWHGLRLGWRLDRRYPLPERLRHWATWLVFHEKDVMALQLPPWAFPAYLVSRPLRVLRRYVARARLRRTSGTTARS